MPGNKGGYDQPYHANSVPFGRNKEITDDFSMLGQAHEAFDKARKKAAGKLREADNGTGGKVVTTPGLSV